MGQSPEMKIIAAGDYGAPRDITKDQLAELVFILCNRLGYNWKVEFSEKYPDDLFFVDVEKAEAEEAEKAEAAE